MSFFPSSHTNISNISGDRRMQVKKMDKLAKRIFMVEKESSLSIAG
jgi:hypothetical protein